MPQNRMMRRPHRPPMGPLGPPGLPPMGPPRGPPLHLVPRGPPVPPLPPHPGLPPPPPGGSLVSSRTNANDPNSKDSRLFVGNLNTIALSKEDIEGIFCPYGLILGISMHKGYAFVQFCYPDEARRAGANEDGKIYAGQALDINIVSQPKNRNALKRSAGTRSVNDAATKKARVETAHANPSLQRTLVTLSESSSAENKVAGKSSTVMKSKAASNKFKSSAVKPEVVKTNWPDVLICGICKLQFTSLHSLAQHKKILCQLRVSTKVKDESATGENDEPSILLCANCDAEFSSAWDLCVHCTEEHKMSIYKTEADENAVCDAGDSNKQETEILEEDSN